MLAVFDLCNNHQYVNTNQFTIKTETALEQQKERQIQDKLESSGLIWNPETGEYEPETGGDIE